MTLALVAEALERAYKPSLAHISGLIGPLGLDRWVGEKRVL
jgi:hypothetical protein